MGAVSPRPYRSETRRSASDATRDRILEAAAELLRAKGPVAFTIDKVASKAGVARMTVYNQVGSKAGLVEAVSDHLAARGGLHRMPEAFQTADAAAGLEKLVRIFTTFWAAEQLPLKRLRAVIALDPELAATNRDKRRRQAIRTLLERRSAPRGDAMDLEELADLLWALTSFETYEHLSAGGRTPEQVADLVVAAIRRLL
jgi:AcrR family transcriptional regulator